MARSKVRRIDLSPDEYIAGTFGQLTPLEFAVYWVALLLIYSRGGAIANDTGRFVAAFKWEPVLAGYRYRARDVRAAVDQLVAMGKLRLTEQGELTNGRAVDELDRTLVRMAKARANGLHGGRPPMVGRSARDRGETGARTARAHSTSKNNNDLAKPNGFQPSTINHHSSLTSTESVAAREAEPSPTARPAHAAKPYPHEPGTNASPGAGQAIDPAAAEQAIRDLGLDPATVPAPTSRPEQPAPISLKPRTSTQQQLEDLATKARARFMRDRQ